MTEPTDTSTVEKNVTTRLKWFNNTRGFGFVVPDDRQDTDAFIHITTLQKAGMGTLGENAVLVCDIQYGTRGAHVLDIIDIIDAGTLPDGAFAHKVAGGQQDNLTGTVKWYKDDKGFGFVVPDDGCKDVFVHKSCLARHGLSGLIQGQRVRLSAKTVPKGREAVNIEILDDAGEFVNEADAGAMQSAATL